MAHRVPPAPAAKCAPRTSGKPRLAIVCRECGAGGSVANVALRQARELASGFEVSMVSDSFPPAGPPGVALSVIEPWRFGALRRYGHVPRELAFCFAATAALRRLAASGLDVVLFHSHASAAIAIPRLRRHGRPRFAMMTHGDIFERPAGTYDRRITAFYRTVTPRAYRAVDLVIALSPSMGEWARNGGAPTGRIAVVPNGVEPEDLGLEPGIEAGPPPPAPPLRALYVGRLAAEKGVNVLLEAIRILKKRGMYTELTVIGSGPKQAEMERTARDFGILDQVVMHGPIARHELAAHYQRAHVVCVPSLSDPLPTVVLEALALGVPVVGSAVGGIPFLVAHGTNGMLFPPGDAAALASSLELLSRDAELLSGLTRNARPSVYPRYSWSSIGQSLGDALLGLTHAQDGAGGLR